VDEAQPALLPILPSQQCCHARLITRRLLLALLAQHVCAQARCRTADPDDRVLLREPLRLDERTLRVAALARKPLIGRLHEPRVRRQER
jgi:hypothetical protein